jgi:hypothetical protein
VEELHSTTVAGKRHAADRRGPGHHSTQETDDDKPTPSPLTCQLLPVDGDYEILDNGSLSVMTSTSRRPVVYMAHEYTRINNSLFICVVPEADDGSDDAAFTAGSRRFFGDRSSHGSPSLIAMYQLDRVQSLASLVGVIVSMTSLIACLLVVLCLPLLRDHSHGRSLVCLIVCLLVGQSLYLLTTLHGYRVFASTPSESVLCYWVGAVTHYFLLAAFFWLNVLAMDTTRSAFSGRDAGDDAQVCGSACPCRYSYRR